MSGSVGQFTTVDATADASWSIRFNDTANAVPGHGEIRRSLTAAAGHVLAGPAGHVLAATR